MRAHPPGVRRAVHRAQPGAGAGGLSPASLVDLSSPAGTRPIYRARRGRRGGQRRSSSRWPAAASESPRIDDRRRTGPRPASGIVGPAAAAAGAAARRHHPAADAGLLRAVRLGTAGLRARQPARAAVHARHRGGAERDPGVGADRAGRRADPPVPADDAARLVRRPLDRLLADLRAPRWSGPGHAGARRADRLHVDLVRRIDAGARPQSVRGHRSLPTAHSAARSARSPARPRWPTPIGPGLSGVLLALHLPAGFIALQLRLLRRGGRLASARPAGPPGRGEPRRAGTIDAEVPSGALSDVVIQPCGSGAGPGLDVEQRGAQLRGDRPGRAVADRPRCVGALDRCRPA